MPKRDYYEVLGLAKSASSDEIRRAHRKLARELHPDINKSPDAAARFAELQEAYEVLSDEKKRSQYDRFGHADPRSAGGPGEGGGPYRWSTQGQDTAHLDMDDLGSVFDAFFGDRYSPGPQAQSPRASRGRRAQRQQNIEIHVPFLVAAKGGTHTARLTIGGESKTIEVVVPPGTAEGAKLRVKPSGIDVHIVFVIRVDPHPILSRSEADGSELDLFLDVPLTIAEATLGATVQVPTLDGSAALAIPPGTSSGRRLRLRGLGIKLADGRRGDLYAVTRVIAPDPSFVSQPVREALEELGKRQPSPRQGAGWPG
jgi:curved DNA-binding protein